MMTILGITGKCFKESDKRIVDLLKKKKKVMFSLKIIGNAFVEFLTYIY